MSPNELAISLRNRYQVQRDEVFQAVTNSDIAVSVINDMWTALLENLEAVWDFENRRLGIV